MIRLPFIYVGWSKCAKWLNLTHSPLHFSFCPISRERSTIKHNEQQKEETVPFHAALQLGLIYWARRRASYFKNSTHTPFMCREFHKIYLIQKIKQKINHSTYYFVIVCNLTMTQSLLGKSKLQVPDTGMSHAVLVNTGTFLVYQYCPKMWSLRSLEHASVIQKLTILEHKNGLVLSNTCVPVSGTWSILFPFVQVQNSRFVMSAAEWTDVTTHTQF